ncbi:MAG: hypothetical protein AUH72_02505 [Acidobacteria bacterium 13_1_40CM_4_65_8]|nr:MAG: hypothetical protein AUH72_02505 [Acidobacteria bacterium 13_1_40CM_4_65_8]
MRPVVLALIVVVVAPLPARGAQSADSQLSHIQRGAGQRPHTVTHPTPPPPPAPPPPPPQVVAPPITFPLPPLMLPPAGGLTPRFGEGVPFRTRPSRHGAFAFGSPFFPPFVTGYSAPADFVDTSRARPAAPAPATGLLRLSVTPLSAQVFIDSYYVGTVEDINAQNVLQLEAGPHRIEIRAPQYQTLTVDVRILPYETVTYRAALELARPPAAVPSPAPPTTTTTMYVIPNCYLGNIPPRANRLPSGCDITQVQVLGPK